MPDCALSVVIPQPHTGKHTQTLMVSTLCCLCSLQLLRTNLLHEQGALILTHLLPDPQEKHYVYQTPGSSSLEQCNVGWGKQLPAPPALGTGTGRKGLGPCTPTPPPAASPHLPPVLSDIQIFSTSASTLPSALTCGLAAVGCRVMSVSLDSMNLRHRCCPLVYPHSSRDWESQGGGAWKGPGWPL